MQACPYCQLSNLEPTDSTLSYCNNCKEHVLPITTKAPKSKNYKERNPQRYTSFSPKPTKPNVFGTKKGKARKGLKKVSVQQGKKNAAYNASESDQNININACARCGGRANLTKHHTYGRSGYTEDGRQAITVWVWLCTSFGNRCHDWVHENPDEAFRLGWLQPEYRGVLRPSYHPKPWRKKLDKMKSNKEVELAIGEVKDQISRLTDNPFREGIAKEKEQMQEWITEMQSYLEAGPVYNLDVSDWIEGRPSPLDDTLT